MPVTLPTGSIITVRHEYIIDSNVSFNLLHYKLYTSTVLSTGLPSAVEPLASDVLPALAAAEFATWAPLWAACVSERLVYTSLTTQKVSPSDRSVPFTYVGDPGEQGGVAGDSLPMQDCVTILKKTGYGQRWGQGRMFLSGIPEAEAEDGKIIDTLVTPIAALANHMDDNISVTVSGIQHVFQPVVTNAPNPSFERVLVIASCSLSDKVIKTQRRRRPGKGI